MPEDVPDLLLLRLDALELDIEKVRKAVTRAKERGQFIFQANESIGPCNAMLRQLLSRLDDIVKAVEEDPTLESLLRKQLVYGDLQAAPVVVAEVKTLVEKAAANLKQAMDTTVSLDEPFRALQKSLNLRCDKLCKQISELHDEVSASPPAGRRDQWREYQRLLDNMARPVFEEYVDFLGGLTVRDTGLDDRVCEMTDALLTRFKSVTQRSLPLPARQAALGNALDSVVLLGFPEWSIWGIPLVGHEVGLAYARDRNDLDLAELVQRFALEAGPGGDGVRHTEEYIHQLLADAFGAYTLGLAYACAALLLRFSPAHDEKPLPSRPRDIDRARVIMMTIGAGGRTAPAAGGSFTDAVEQLKEIWEGAVRAHAGPALADEAVEEAQGPPPKEDWLDDFSRLAVRHFASLVTIRPYDNERWQASEEWCKALREESAGPGWTPNEDAVADVLTAAWRLRLFAGMSPNPLAEDVKKRWSTRRR